MRVFIGRHVVFGRGDAGGHGNVTLQPPEQTGTDSAFSTKSQGGSISAIISPLYYLLSYRHSIILNFELVIKYLAISTRIYQ